MYPRTPIKIIGNQVYAYTWNGKEYRCGLPVYRLNKPTKGGWRNARTLSYPARSNVFIALGKVEQ